MPSAERTEEAAVSEVVGVKGVIELASAERAEEAAVTGVVGVKGVIRSYHRQRGYLAAVSEVVGVIVAIGREGGRGGSGNWQGGCVRDAWGERV